MAKARRYTAGDGCTPAALKATGEGAAFAVKRSDDHGATFWPRGGVIVMPSSNVSQCEALVYDSQQSRLILWYWNGLVLETTRCHLVWSGCNVQRQSTDLGSTWSPERMLDLGSFNYSMPGPGRGVQLRTSGPHAGHLLFPVHKANVGSDRKAWGHTMGVFIIDDGGRQWRLGLSLNYMASIDGHLSVPSLLTSGKDTPPGTLIGVPIIGNLMDELVRWRNLTKLLDEINPVALPRALQRAAAQLRVAMKEAQLFAFKFECVAGVVVDPVKEL